MRSNAVALIYEAITSLDNSRDTHTRNDRWVNEWIDRLTKRESLQFWIHRSNDDELLVVRDDCGGGQSANCSINL